MHFLVSLFKFSDQGILKLYSKIPTPNRRGELMS